MAVNLLKKNSLALVASLLLAGHVQATELLNSSYDVSRELFAALNPPFEQQWAKDNGGDKLTIKQSHAGSSKQATIGSISSKTILEVERRNAFKISLPYPRPRNP